MNPRPDAPAACEPQILDACCGGRMWWWDKHHPLAICMDNRVKPRGSHSARPNWHITPDLVGDFRAIPFPDEAFRLVLFDPPHNVRENPSGIYSLYYGALSPETEQDDLQRGFAECWRVLAPGGTLVFKWAGKLTRVKPHFPATPIVGTRSNQMSGGLGTRWFVFYKPLAAAVQEVADCELLPCTCHLDVMAVYCPRHTPLPGEDSKPPESMLQCAAWIGRGVGRCPNMGLRENDRLSDDGTGRGVWISHCEVHG